MLRRGSITSDEHQQRLCARVRAANNRKVLGTGWTGLGWTVVHRGADDKRRRGAGGCKLDEGDTSLLVLVLVLVLPFCLGLCSGEEPTATATAAAAAAAAMTVSLIMHTRLLCNRARERR